MALWCRRQGYPANLQRIALCLREVEVIPLQGRGGAPRAIGSAEVRPADVLCSPLLCRRHPQAHSDNCRVTRVRDDAPCVDLNVLTSVDIRRGRCYVELVDVVRRHRLDVGRIAARRDQLNLIPMVRARGIPVDSYVWCLKRGRAARRERPVSDVSFDSRYTSNDLAVGYISFDSRDAGFRA